MRWRNAMCMALMSGLIAAAQASVQDDVGHRANPGTPFEQQIKNCYMPEIIELAENSGFKLAAKSEVNANAEAARDHLNGVRILPPAMRERLDPESTWPSVTATT